jgi:peptidoglycan/LPS O-acetylase OafA/YrhL
MLRRFPLEMSQQDTGGKRLPYMPGLDGLRALAVLAVFVYHFHNGGGWLPGGFLGVDIFFVISGYLITSLLLSEFRKEGRVDLVAFWLRRARRLLPAVGVLIAVVMVLGAFFDFGQISTLRGQALASMGYVTNWELIFSHQSYFQEFARPSLFRHLWSLAVEEQFYLLWPLVFAACMTRFGHRRVVVGVIAGAIASSLLMAILFDPANPNRVFYGTDTRATPLLVGVALAFFWHPERLKPKTGMLAPIALDVVGVFGLAMVLVTFLTVHDFDLSLYHGGFLLLSLWTALLIAALAHPAAHLGRVVGNPGMRWLGLRSYSFYLWHWPVLELTRPGIDVPLHGPVLFALQLAATLALADLSYRYVEQPFRRSTSWQRPDWLRIGRVGIAVGVTAVVIVVGWSGIVPRGHPGQLRVASAQITPRAASISAPVEGPPTASIHPASKAPSPKPIKGKRAKKAAPLPVLALGDSVMVDARSGMARLLGGGLTLNAAVGRQPSEIVSLLHNYAAAGKVPDNVVLQIGNNGPVYGDDLAKLHQALRGVPHVYLVNVEVPRSWQGEVNSTLSEAARSWGQAELVDWHKVASSHDDITTDGIHLTEKGIDLYSRLIAASVRTAANKAS